MPYKTDGRLFCIGEEPSLCLDAVVVVTTISYRFHFVHSADYKALLL
jgi:hypothetical protein